MNNIKKKIKKVQSDPAVLTLLHDIEDLLLNKYLYLVILAVFIFCSGYIAGHKLGNEKLILYYSLNGEHSRYLPNALFGFSALGIKEMPVLTALYKAIFLVILAFYAFIYYLEIKKTSILKEKICILSLFTVVFFIFSKMIKTEDHAFNIFIASFLLSAAVLLFKNRKAVFLVPLLAALAQLAELRTILCIIPLSVILPVLKNKISTENIKRYIYTFIVSAILMAAVFAVTQFLSAAPPVNDDGMSVSVIKYISDGISISNSYTNFHSASNFCIFICTMLFLINIFFLGRSEKIAAVAVSVYYLIMYIISAENGIYLSAWLVFETAALFFLRKDKDISKRSAVKMLFTGLIVSCIVSILHQRVYGTDYTMPEFTQYYITYFDLGFVQRGLIGTLFRLIFGNVIPENVIVPAAYIFYLSAALIFTGILFGIYMTCTDTKAKTIYGLILAAFILSPAFAIHFSDNVLRFDLYNDILTIISLILAVRNKKTICLVPILCTICILVHQVYVSISYPIVFSALAYRAFVESDSHNVRNKAVFFITLLLMGVGFFYLTFFSAQHLALSYDDVITMLSSRSDNFINEDTVYKDLVILWLDKTNTQLVKYSANIPLLHKISTAKMFIANIPLLAAYIFVYMRSAANESKIIKKLAYAASMISVLALTPLFLTEIDYGRWGGHYLFILLFGIASLTLMQSRDKKWYNGISDKKLYICAGILIFLMMIQDPFHIFLASFNLRLF